MIRTTSNVVHQERKNRREQIATVVAHIYTYLLQVPYKLMNK
jgi:hypothetical protein